MKNRIITLILSCVIILSVTGCGNNGKPKDKDKGNGNPVQQGTKKKDGGTLIFAAASDPTSLNPFFRQNRVTYTVSNALFDPLFIMDGDKIRYYLASELKISEDMLTYNIKLKDNLKWHDGKKITADDIVFTINTILNEKENIEARGNFVINNKPVEVNKIDELTVQFKLPQVYAPFKSKLDDFRPIPKHIFEGKSDIAKQEASISKPIGSGPYKLKEWKKGETLTLERFKDYYSGKPNIDQVVFRTVGDSNSSSVAFQNGELTVSYLNDAKYLQYKDNDKFKTYTFDEGMLNYIVINTKNNSILQKKEVRKAICYALNKDEILSSDAGTTELTKKAYSIMPPTTLYYSDKVEKYVTNIDKAKELLKVAGVSNGKIDFNYNSSNEIAKKQALVVQQQLKKIGLEVKLTAIDTQAYFGKLTGSQERNFDLMTNGYVMGTEPSAYQDVYSSIAPYNASNYNSAEVDELFKKADIEKDEKKRQEYYGQIQKIIAEDAIVYPLDYSISKVGTAKNLAGVEDAKLVPIYMFEDLSKLYFTE